MKKFNLKVITPKRQIIDEMVESITLPSKSGEITILANHTTLFSLLVDGIVKIKNDGQEEFFAIGGGYVETDGKTVSVLVSRAHGQDELDEAAVAEAQDKAKKIIAETTSTIERNEAMSALRRSIIDMKLVSKLKKRAPRE